MKYQVLVFFLLLVPVLAYADTERGPNYIKTTTIDGNDVTVVWQSAPEWIFNGAGYVPFIYVEDDNIIQVETAHGSVVLDKSSCGFSFFSKGRISTSSKTIFTDSIIAKIATNGTDIWSNLDSINNSVCVPGWDGKQLTAKRSNQNGVLEYKYINLDDKWKTQLEATNLSSLTDKKFGFTQVIDLNRDTIRYAGQERNIDNLDGSTFDRTFLEANQGKIINLLVGASYDFDLAFDNLWAISVYDTGVNKSKLAFDFTNNAPVVFPNETLILDPLIFNETGTTLVQESTQSTGASCSTPGTTAVPDQARELFYPDTTANDECNSVSYEWDISSIDDSATISDVTISVDVDFVSNMIVGQECDIFAMHTQPSVTGRGSVHFTDILNGTMYVNNDDFCLTTGNDKSVDLGSSADSDLAASLSNDWFAIGIVKSGHGRDGATRQASFADVDLIVTYTDILLPITDLGCTFNNDPSDYSVDCEWTAPLADPPITGYQIQRDIGDGFTVLINDTGNTNLYYNDTALDIVSPWHRYDVRAWNSLGSSSISNTQNVTTINNAAVALVTVPAIVGDVSAANYTISYDGFPKVITIGNTPTFVNGSQTTNEYFLNPIVALNFEGDVTDSANSNDGTVNGTTSFADGVTGSGFDFDNATRITIGDTPFDFDKNDPFSLSAWIKTDAIGETDIIIGKLQSGQGWQIFIKNDEQLRFRHGTTSNGAIVVDTVGADVRDGYWHHVAAVFDGTDANGVTIYVDSQPVQTTIITNNLTGSTLNNIDVTVGDQNPTSTFLFTGQMDDVEIFGYALGQNEINVLSGQSISYVGTTDWVLLNNVSTSINHGVSVIYWNGTTQATNSTVTNQTLDFDPSYFEAIVSSQGFVNYTTERLNNQDSVHLTVNRDKNGTTWQAECLFQTASEAQFANQSGTWYNKTNVGWLNATIDGFQNSNSYISCYNEDWLFTTISYTNSSLSLAGIQAFDDIYGGFLGVPVAIFFLVLVAGYASPRTAPIWLVVVLAMAGIMSATGFFTLSTEIWALMLVAGIMGLFVGRKLF